MNKVLIADDNTQITKVLKDYASKEGWGCYVAYNGEEALRLFREFSREITIVFLDVMMPRKDGFAVCKAIRAMSQVPVIMITARSEDADKIMGLDIGADDYIVKPFSAAEVMARARAILRRIPQQEESKSRKLVIANLTIDIDNYMVTIDDKEVPLTKREKELLW
ncbi:MAG: response regulator transcription factor, partial [Acidaminococcaceae bacterium]|nr:response regulator transcription factor [Acidaminococcaceae bacterium]